MKRTKAQEDFDLATHGWVFCDKDMLHYRLPSFRELAKKLSKNDKRHKQLLFIEREARNVPR